MEKLERQQVLKDPIYGYIHIDYKVIKDVLNTSVFQRLRRVRQLSGVQMVFHGAEHSRFSHSLGVYEVAYRFLSVPDIDQRLSAREKGLFLTTAMLHDIGHGAYSHAFEDIVGTNHEHVGARLILEHKELRKVLDLVDDNFALDVANILLKQKRFPLIEQLISSQLDVDRLDYLERDAYFTGTAYGHIDLDRIIRVCQIVDDKIVFKASGIGAIENYLISRYHMYWQVYYHAVSRAYEVILEKIYQRVKKLCLEGFAFKSNMIPLKKVIEDPNDLENYLLIDDYYMNGLIASFINSEDHILKNLANDFLNRHIWAYLDDVKENKKAIDEIINSFDEEEQTYYTANKSVSNLTYVDGGKNFGDKIYILKPNGEVTTLKDASEIIKSLVESGKRSDPKFFYRKS
ncbi:MAG: HD domain-containing protein [Acholeplasmataceae bacterium]